MRATWVTPGLVRTLRARGWVVPVTAFTAAAALVTGLLVGVAGPGEAKTPSGKTPGEAKTPSGKTPGGSGVATATGPLTAADLASAVATARLRKARVEVLGLGTDRSRTWVNPGGTLTTRTFELPVRYRVGGRWVDVDTTLAAVADGSVAPRGHVRGLRLTGAGAGSVVFTDAKGKFAGVIPAPVMWDASVDPRSLEHTRHAPVAMWPARSCSSRSSSWTTRRSCRRR